MGVLQIPKELQAMADAFAAKRKAGTVVAKGSGFGGTGFKFDENEAVNERRHVTPPHESCRYRLTLSPIQFILAVIV